MQVVVRRVVLRMMQTLQHGWAALCLGSVALAGPTPAMAVPEKPFAPFASIEVIFDQPVSNYAYFDGHGILFGAVKPRPAVGWYGDLLTSLVANVVVNAVQHARMPEVMASARVVEQSLTGLDLHASAALQFRQLVSEAAPRLVLSADTVPPPQPPPPTELNPVSGRRQSVAFVDPKAHLVARARASAQAATLFVTTVPLFRLESDTHGFNFVSFRAELYSRAGVAVAQWQLNFKGPEVPDVAMAERAQWWAEGRAERFALHGLRAGLMWLLDDLREPGRIAERTRQRRALMTFDEVGRPTFSFQHHDAEAQKLWTSHCALGTGSGPIVYQYRYIDFAKLMAVSAHCKGEGASGGTGEVVPGLGWTRTVEAPLLKASPAPASAPAASAPSRP